ncbi:MAG: hypothetical protein HY912_18465 [Desulfomonile tiedjei]|uniref:phosphoribosylglycinamide formyltransferase 1 n=1 Tax=Desulfomonile tiedjei TaxID=2358 RepID=A0A9D6V4Q0_9BACT|nr:hypothetical protein [Desulfomonile tiedjei]
MTRNCSSVSVLVLACCGTEQYALINSLAGVCCIRGIVLERRGNVLGKVFVKRIKRLGPLVVLDQLIFKVLDVFVFRPNAESRASELLDADVSFDENKFENARILRTRSVNSPEVLNLVSGARPDVVVVSGVSILGNDLLDLLRGVPIVNIHCGITPRYRGTHGAFWAVVNGDWDNVGVTVHLIDKGVDTGPIIDQENIKVDHHDNPRTLAFKQNAAGIRLVGKALSDIKPGETAIMQRPDLDSRVYSSPTITAYLRYRSRMKERFSP